MLGRSSDDATADANVASGTAARHDYGGDGGGSVGVAQMVVVDSDTESTTAATPLTLARQMLEHDRDELERWKLGEARPRAESLRRWVDEKTSGKRGDGDDGDDGGVGGGGPRADAVTGVANPTNDKEGAAVQELSLIHI